MELNEYQAKARLTRLESTKGLSKGYAALGLAGEAGEVADKVKKIIRGDLAGKTPEERAEYNIEVAKELSDVLWYIAALADDLEIPLATIAQANLDKLASRAERGKIQGSGDNR